MELQINTVFEFTPEAAAIARQHGMPGALSFTLGATPSAAPWPGVGDMVKVGDDEAWLFEVISRVFHYRSSIELELALLLGLPTSRGSAAAG